MMHPALPVTAQEQREIAAIGLLDPKTVRAVYRAGRVRPASQERVRRAALALGLPLPPVQTERHP
jgi:hypothetical protein